MLGAVVPAYCCMAGAAPAGGAVGAVELYVGAVVVATLAAGVDFLLQLNFFHIPLIVEQPHCATTEAANSAHVIDETRIGFPLH